jgi:polysaccharide deacetylase 2 family uncharacterized protein YibQ
MADEPKKHNTKSSNRRRRSSGRKKPVQKIVNNSNVKKSILIVLGVLLMISLVAFGYFLGKNDVENNTPINVKDQKNKIVHEKKMNVNNFSKIKTPEPEVKNKELVKVKLPEIKPSLEIKPKEEEEKPKVVKKEPKVRLEDSTGKPKLVIIIDDVSNARQLRNIQALHMKITPSIFPPSERSMRSHTLARGLQHYMIHLPMESGSEQFNKQYKTLKITFSKAQIIARAKELRRLFPSARYVNNHTGSVFTDNYNKMLTLYVALKDEGFKFVDSRTIASTKVPKIAKKLGDDYVARDTFIDNVHNIKSIHKQLRIAVAIAKKKGHAIAIGHPHPLTMKALLSAGSILNDVELVYMDDLMTI